MYEFNINDYIWYIVGGVALFFILIGFIADKSGLAKKTFSKDSTNKKKAMPEQNSDVSVSTQSVPESFVIPNDSDIPVAGLENNEQSDFLIDSVPVEDNAVLDESVLNQEEVSNEEVSLEPVDSFSSEEPIYLNNDDEVSEDSPSFNLEDSYSQINESGSENNDDSVWDLDSNEVVLDDENSPVAVENAEDDWGIDSSNDSDVSLSLEDVELPNLEDINSNTEEDVWKF